MKLNNFVTLSREAITNYKVTKNRLARLALKGTQYEGLDEASRVRRR